MTVTIDQAQEFIIKHIHDWMRGDAILSKANCDIHLDTTVNLYIDKHQSTTLSALDKQRPSKNTYQAIFLDAIWDLCRKGILRPGTNSNPHSSCALTLADPGFSITEFGKDWLEKYAHDALLPADPNKFTVLFSNFQKLYGASYFRRAKEAVMSLQMGNFLACCVMSGAASESILLSAAFLIKEKNEVLKQYLCSNGRSKIENLVFGKTSQHIKDRYSRYTDIISYWRNQSGHGHEVDIDVDQAYISLLTLLRFAEFMRGNWSEITGATTSLS